MLKPRWRKVLRDLFSNKTRTVLVVLSIAVGVFAVGMILSSRVMLERDMNGGFQTANPFDISLRTDLFDDDLVQAVQRTPGVAEAEGRRSFSVRVKVGPDEWRNLSLDAVQNYRENKINMIQPVSGAWPPPKREVLIERASLAYIKADVGEEIVIELPDGKQRSLRVAGVVKDVMSPNANLMQSGAGFITLDTMEWLGQPREFGEMRVTVTDQSNDRAKIEAIADTVETKIEKGGRQVYGKQIPTPGKHPADEVLQPLLLIMGVVGFFSLLLSGFLVVNTIGALLTQQVRQIGIMKSIGGRNRQLVGMYLVTVLVFGALSLLVAVPLGAVGAWGFTSFLASMINFDVANYGVPPQVLLLETAVGLLVPVLAALVPIISGTRITVREAISDYGVGKGRFGKSWIDRLLERVRGLSRPTLLSLRNTFRRKGRLFLTLTTLTLAGTIFITVFTVRDSLMLTLDDALEYWKYDIEIGFARPYQVAQIEREALRIPGVVDAESWGGGSVQRLRPDGREGEGFPLIAPPAGSKMLNPRVLTGRWLLPADQNAIVLNSEVLADEPDIKVGDEIVLKLDGHNTTWHVVGTVQGILSGAIGYTNNEYYRQVAQERNRSSSLQIITSDHSTAFQTQTAKALKDHFDARGMRVDRTMAFGELSEGIKFQFNIIIALLLVMAVLLAVVGGLGLMGTMSINVLERTREIGVMRAIGASNGAIRRIVIIEGVLIGVISWLLGTGLAIPLSRPLSDAVGVALLQSPLSYVFSTSGALIWLGVVLLLSALASVLPAWNASRLTVRAVLAYE